VSSGRQADRFDDKLRREHTATQPGFDHPPVDIRQLGRTPSMARARHHPRFGRRHPLREQSTGLAHVAQLAFSGHEQRRTRGGEEPGGDAGVVRVGERPTERPRISGLDLGHEVVEARPRRDAEHPADRPSHDPEPEKR
jgi:hypothetical protein